MAETKDQTGATSPSPAKRSVPNVALLARELGAYQNAVDGAALAQSLLNNSGLATAAASLVQVSNMQHQAMAQTVNAAGISQMAREALRQDAAVKAMLDQLPTVNEMISQMVGIKATTAMLGLDPSSVIATSIRAMQDAEKFMAQGLPRFDHAAAATRLATVSKVVDELELNEAEVEAELAPIIDINIFVYRHEVDLVKVLDLQDPKVRKRIVFAVQAAVYLAIVGTIAANPSIMAVAVSLFALLGVNPKVIDELTGKATQAALDKYAPLKDDDGVE